MILNWDKFEVLLGAATGTLALEQMEREGFPDIHLRKVVNKRQELERQQMLFTQATEETILQEYQRLRKAHREFLRSFNEAHAMYQENQE